MLSKAIHRKLDLTFRENSCMMRFNGIVDRSGSRMKQCKTNFAFSTYYFFTVVRRLLHGGLALE
jgi:hypothetical protein